MDFDKVNNKIIQLQEAGKYDFIYSMKELRIAYKEYAKIIAGRKSSLGFPSFNYSIYGGVKPGYVCGAVADTDVGKTAYALHLAYDNAELLKDLLILFFSLETPHFDVYERTVQSKRNVSSIEVEQAFQQDTEEKLNYLGIEQRYPNLYTITKRVSVQEIPVYKGLIENLTKKQTGLVIVDWGGLVKNEEYFKDFERATENMRDFEEMAMFYKLPFMILHQIPRDAARREEADLHSAKGTGEIEAISKIFISINRWNIADLPDIEADVKIALENNLIRILKFRLEKKKYGMFDKDKPEIPVLMNKKSLELCEYHPTKKFHLKFMERVKQSSKIAKGIFDEPF